MKERLGPLQPGYGLVHRVNEGMPEVSRGLHRGQSEWNFAAGPYLFPSSHFQRMLQVG